MRPLRRQPRACECLLAGGGHSALGWCGGGTSVPAWVSHGIPPSYCFSPPTPALPMCPMGGCSCGCREMRTTCMDLKWTLEFTC